MGKTESVFFADLILDETCLFARRGDTTIQFTRNERALLLALSRNPHRLMSRSDLIEKIASLDADTADRNIDFLVNRLRAKLGDSAKSPRYIATQYGEGYVWIAEPSAVPIGASPQSGPVDAWLAIVPASVGQRDRIDARALSLLTHLRDGIAAGMSPAQKIVIADDWRSAASIGLRYVLQVSFQTINDRPACAATLREMPSKHIVRAFRLNLADSASFVSEATRVSRGTIKELHDALSDASAGLGTPSDQPLDIRLRKASTLLSSSNPAWLEKGQELSAARADNPSDPDIALQWCLHLFARLVLANPFTGLGSEERDEIEDEIEATVLDCLPAVQSNPLLMLAAAKLLYFVDRGHLDLADDLAERAFARTADFAAALPVMGQLRQARGNFNEAVILFDRGIEMADPDSEFLQHMRVLKCIALLAKGDRNALDAASTFTGDMRYGPPELVVMMGMAMTAADQPLPEAVVKTLTAVGPVGVRNALEYVYFASARHFIAQGARANVMRGLVDHAMRLHGPAAIPPIVPAGTGIVAAP
ncbi:Transcriptional regulatory protein, C terminal [Devosia limi DSM 17137]|uniref:Transcriptional regulatory protein, C terminal n=2 Tax=Devosia TaxID=46913 RepID=A0A1M5FTJ0_9HYPH|nr:Transcriptional regulatory protein, C terminal [Devosia limi DSM 17137]